VGAANEEAPAMKDKISKKGFTLVELMIVIAVVAILVALAIPSYTAYIRKANRGEAQQLLMNWANNQEIWRANNPAYAGTGDIAAPTHDKYNFSPSAITATTYTLTADPQGDQVKDKAQGQVCDPLTLDQSSSKTPDVCW
jgi:type IV pilus assembly protein PilE